ncbi:hypothetical protein AB1L88_25875 [Tautonia sp. JC769]|uniref:hypothetical protein n=1 Tax=Tautonia sp. JC769 TaxID=3232135 RepID=UPI003458B85A
MHYKTITLALLEANPSLCARLKAGRQLLSTMERLATELKASHQSLMEQLRTRNPMAAPEQIASQALELAVEALQDRIAEGLLAGDSGLQPIFLGGTTGFSPPPTPNE